MGYPITHLMRHPLMSFSFNFSITLIRDFVSKLPKRCGTDGSATRAGIILQQDNLK